MRPSVRILLCQKGKYYLEEAELVGSLVRPDDQGFDIADIDVAAGNGERWRAVLGKK